MKTEVKINGREYSVEEKLWDYYYQSHNIVGNALFFCEKYRRNIVGILFDKPFLHYVLFCSNSIVADIPFLNEIFVIEDKRQLYSLLKDAEELSVQKIPQKYLCYPTEVAVEFELEDWTDRLLNRRNLVKI